MVVVVVWVDMVAADKEEMARLEVAIIELSSNAIRGLHARFYQQHPFHARLRSRLCFVI